jgi:uncharacterized protein (DUF433 family)
MTAAAFEPEPVPLTADAGGGLRVGGTRVLLESLVAAFDRGDSPEEIREQFPSVSLGDVYAVLTYYVRHHGEVEAYLAERERRGDAVRARVEAEFPADGLRARLLARLGD